MYFMYFPLAANSMRLSANWMQFYSKYGSKGLEQFNLVFTGDTSNWVKGIPEIKKFFRIGVDGTRQLLLMEQRFDEQQIEKLLSFLFPPTNAHLYLLLDYLALNEPWYRVGTWDLARGGGAKQSSLIIVDSLQQSGGASFSGFSRVGKVNVDYMKGVGRVGQIGKVSLAQFTIHDGWQPVSKYYEGAGRDYSFYVMRRGKFGLLGKKEAGESTFVKLFFENKFDSRYFSPIMMNLPYYMLCKVTGDQYGN